jgi:hypothetical protein
LYYRLSTLFQAVYQQKGLVLIRFCNRASLLIAVLILAFSSAALATNSAPCGQLTVNVTPAPPATVAPGGPVTLSGSLTSCSAAPEKITVSYLITGPNNYSDSYTTRYSLPANGTRTDSVTVAAPAASGTYVIDVTATSNGTVLATTSLNVIVQ